MQALRDNPGIASLADDYFAIALRAQSEFVPGTSKLINLRQLEGIKAKVGELRDGEETGIEYVLFEARRHDERTAEQWATENRDRHVVDIIYRDFEAEPKKPPQVKWPQVVVCRTGEWVTSDGSELKITKKMLGEIAKNYDPALDEAPVIANEMGEPHFEQGEAKGWVKELKVLGEYLIATVKDVAEAFKEKIKSGAWKKRSIRIHYDDDKYSNPQLRHVAFLGAVHPAVMGMPDVEFATQLSCGADARTDRDVYFEIDNRNNVTPITLTIAAKPEKEKETTSQGQTGDGNMADMSEDLKELTKEKADLEEKVKALEAEKSTASQRADLAEKAVKDSEHQRKRTELEAYLEEQIREGRLLPKVKDDKEIISMMEALSESPDHLKAFKSFVGIIPKKVVEFAELTGEGGKGTGKETAFTRQVKESVEASSDKHSCPVKDFDKVAELETRAKKLMAEDSSLSKAEAFRRVIVEMNLAGEVTV